MYDELSFPPLFLLQVGPARPGVIDIDFGTQVGFGLQLRQVGDQVAEKLALLVASFHFEGEFGLSWEVAKLYFLSHLL